MGSAPQPPWLARRGLLAALAMAGIALGCGGLGGVSVAGAVVRPAVTLDGPSEDIVGFGGVAMAEDGSGGVVYLKRVEGVPHVFVSRYVNGAWLPPIRVDTEEPYAASWPRIGAANGGELVVVWATPFATTGEGRPVQELLSATLGPGASLFGPAMIVDPEIGDGTGTSPDLAMSSTGQADVVYRVVDDHNGSVPLLRPGDVVEDVRVARFNGETWTRLGAVNRDSGISMRPPTAANAPQIAIGPNGNGIVVWQEPEINGVARIWARRIFGSSLDYVLPVSAETLNGSPIGADADAPSVAFSRLGQAEVAYRQAYSAGSPLPGPRIFLNILSDGESTEGAQFAGASIADGAVPGGTQATVGPPSIDIDEKQQMRMLYDDDGSPRVIEGDDLGLTAAVTLGPGFAGGEPLSASVMNPSGGGVSAWPSADPHGAPGVAVREDFPGGGVQTALVSGGEGGPVSELSVARSGLGDGLVAFRQGPLGAAAIVAAQASAPPAQFVVSVPHQWLKPARTEISWLPAPSANAPITYQLLLDGRPQGPPTTGLGGRIEPRGLGPGEHDVQVLATDSQGQETLTPPSILRLDGRAPSVSVSLTRGGAAVRVRVSDPDSGVDTAAVRVSFGDGAHAAKHSLFNHRYARAGIYRIVVLVRDNVGNTATVRRLVSVR